jgi:cell division septation protein DedD
LPKNEEGEFELILGNRQLISVFVIVVALLGVFFSMGYIVGRNSSPAGGATEARADKSTSETHPAESASTDSSSSAEPSDAQAQPNGVSDAVPSATTPPSITQPEKPAPAPPAAKPAPIAKEPKPKPSPAREAAPAPQHAAVSTQIAPGQYWQVVATARPDAEIIAEALAKKGLHAVLAPAPKDGVFRVLVGPLADAPTQAQTRTKLEAAGFKNPIMRKY